VKRRITVFVILALLAAIVWVGVLWRNAKGQEHDLLAMAAQYPLYGQINTPELLATLAEIGDDLDLTSTGGIPWKKLLENPREIGVNLLTNPVFFSDGRSLCIAFVLRDEDRFGQWVDDVLLQEIPGKKDLKEFKRVLFDGSSAELLWKDEILLIQVLGKKDPSPFFSIPSEEGKTHFKGQGLMEFSVEKRVPEVVYFPRALGHYVVSISRDQILVSKGECPVDLHQGVCGLLSVDSTGQMIEILKPYLSKLTGRETLDLPRSDWQLKFTGLDTLTTTKVSYEYDENFEKQEVLQTFRDVIPSLTFSYTDTTINGQQFSKIGTYETFLQEYSGYTSIGFSKSPERTELAESIEAYVDVVEIHNVLRKLGIQHSLLDSMKDLGLERARFVNRPEVFCLKIETTGEAHVLGHLAKFLLQKESNILLP
jgi:hypothetical protein